MTKAEIQKLNDDMERLSKSHAELLRIAKIIEGAYAERPPKTFHTRVNELSGGGSGAFANLLMPAIANAEKVGL